MDWSVPKALVEGVIPSNVVGTYVRVGPVAKAVGIEGREEHELERNAALLSIIIGKPTPGGSGIRIRYKEIAPSKKSGKKICTRPTRIYGLLSDLNTYLNYRGGHNSGWFYSPNYGAHIQEDMIVLTSPFGPPSVVDINSLTPLGTHPHLKSVGKIRTEHHSGKHIGFSVRRKPAAVQLVVTEGSIPIVTAWVPPSLMTHDFIITADYFVFYLCGGLCTSELADNVNVVTGLTAPVDYLNMDKSTNQYFDDSKNSLLLIPRVVEAGTEPKLLTIPIKGFVTSFGGVVRDLKSEILISSVIASDFNLTNDGYSYSDSSLNIMRVDLVEKQCLQTRVVNDVERVVMNTHREAVPCRYAYCWNRLKLVKYDCSTGREQEWVPPQSQFISGVTFAPPSDSHTHHQEDDANLILQLNSDPTTSEGSHFVIMCSATLSVKASVPIPMHLPPSTGSTFSLNTYLQSHL